MNNVAVVGFYDRWSCDSLVGELTTFLDELRLVLYKLIPRAYVHGLSQLITCFSNRVGTVVCTSHLFVFSASHPMTEDWKIYIILGRCFDGYPSMYIGIIIQSVAPRYNNSSTRITTFSIQNIEEYFSGYNVILDRSIICLDMGVAIFF